MIISLPKEFILKAFLEAKDEETAIINLFADHVPDYHLVASMNHHPQISKNTVDWLLDLLHTFGKLRFWSSQKINMLWLQFGFGCTKQDMNDFELFVDMDKITYIGRDI